jgi:hypothetical protein
MKAETKVSKRTLRNWNDIQTAIATVAIVTTLGMWNLFATPTKKETAQTEQPISPTEQPPVETTPTSMPQIMFATQTVAQAVIPQPQQPQPTKKHKNNRGNGGGSGSGTVTTTKTS